MDSAIDRNRSLFVTVVRFFSFFTILTNLLIAIGLTTGLLAPRSRMGAFFARPAVTGGTALYITIVALVYNLVLRQTWSPAGWWSLADELLHVVVPALFLVHWAMLPARGRLPWTTALVWLVYPAGYLVVTLLRGPWLGGYPYSFLDVPVLGYGGVLRNAALLVLVFLVLGLAFIGLDRLLGRRKS